VSQSIDRCYTCGQKIGNGPLPLAGECSCLFCDVCGMSIDTDMGYCVKCDDEYEPDEDPRYDYERAL
jgi:hypothetical protein